MIQQKLSSGDSAQQAASETIAAARERAAIAMRARREEEERLLLARQKEQELQLVQESIQVRLSTTSRTHVHGHVLMRMPRRSAFVCLHHHISCALPNTLHSHYYARVHVKKRSHTSHSYTRPSTGYSYTHGCIEEETRINYRANHVATNCNCKGIMLDLQL